jgi:pSer/pThr/pTyr-binding forkhead associated (FHA) protein
VPGAVVQAFPMGPICSRCRGANTPGAEFCRFCGTPLVAASASAAASSDTGRDTVVVRRVEPAAAPHPGMSTVPSSVSPITPVPAALAEASVRVGGAAAHAPAIAVPEEEVHPPAIAEVAPPRAPPVVRLAVATQAMGATSTYALAQLTTILRDGTTGVTYPLTAEQTDIGREEGNILLPDDPYICPRHARMIRRDGRFLLRDLNSVNGVFLRIAGAAELKDRDAFLVGQELLVFELVEDGEGGLGPAVQHGTLVFGAPEVQRLARLSLWTTEGVPRDVYTLHRQETILGREVGDIVFPEDAFMSRRHAAVTCDLHTRHFTLRDLDSSNGTYLRFRGEREVRFGDRFRIGQHLFRFDPAGAT